MSEEERKAIEYLQNYKYDNEVYQAIETVLNLVKKQQEEIEKKDKEILRYSRTANEYKKAIECKTCDCSVCEAHLNNIEIRKELEKKDKIIDEMAKYIATLDTDEDICKNIEPSCEDYAGEKKITCDVCLKQYFENKVEGSK